ncbi:MAG TPA: hypothetical protein VII37_04200, partial [Candidatus Acidoferrum sp.]
MSWFNASTAMAFLAWFGGIGYILSARSHLASMGRPDIARIRRDAEVATAEAERDIAIKRAESLRASAVAKA